MAPAKKTVQRATKSIYRPELQTVVTVLRSLREGTGLNQTSFAARLGRTQSYVSAAERGAKMDALQIRDWCQACGVDLIQWATQVERALKAEGK